MFKMTWWRDHPGEETFPWGGKTQGMIGANGGEPWPVIMEQMRILGDESLGHQPVIRVEIERVDASHPMAGVRVRD